MRVLKNFKVVAMTYSEIAKKAVFVKGNRNAFLSLEDALKNGFTKSDHARLVKRVKNNKKMFKDNGYYWDENCAMRVFSRNGNLEIGDAQGRFIAIGELIKEGVLSPNFEIPVIINETNETDVEVINHIQNMNTNSQAWNNSDKIRSKMMNGTEEQKELYNTLLDTASKLDIPNGGYMARRLTFGEEFANKKLPKSLKDIDPYREIRIGYFSGIYDYINKRNEESDCANLVSRVKGSDMGILFDDLFKKMLAMNNGDSKKTVKLSNDFVSLFAKRCEKFDSIALKNKYLIGYKNNGKAVFSEFMQKGLTNAKVKKALKDLSKA